MSLREGPNRALAVAVALLILLSLVTVITVARPADAKPVTPAGPASSIAITATTSYSYTPNEIQQVATNTSVSVAFTDASDLAHTFTIIGKQGWVIPSTISESAFSTLVYGQNPKVLFNLNISGAGTLNANFTSPGTGWYEFVCTEAGHFQLGMYGFIAFGMNLPANLTVAAGTPGPGAALFIIIGTIAGLVVVTLVLGFWFGRRHGSQHEMPPERLGYPEPQTPGGTLPSNPEEPPHR